jgi:hypothetical protein
MPSSESRLMAEINGSWLGSMAVAYCLIKVLRAR